MEDITKILQEKVDKWEFYREDGSVDVNKVLDNRDLYLILKELAELSNPI